MALGAAVLLPVLSLGTPSSLALGYLLSALAHSAWNLFVLGAPASIKSRLPVWLVSALSPASIFRVAAQQNNAQGMFAQNFAETGPVQLRVGNRTYQLARDSATGAWALTDVDNPAQKSPVAEGQWTDLQDAVTGALARIGVNGTAMYFMDLSQNRDGSQVELLTGLDLRGPSYFAPAAVQAAVQATIQDEMAANNLTGDKAQAFYSKMLDEKAIRSAQKLISERSLQDIASELQSRAAARREFDGRAMILETGAALIVLRLAVRLAEARRPLNGASPRTLRQGWEVLPAGAHRLEPGPGQMIQLYTAARELITLVGTEAGVTAYSSTKGQPVLRAGESQDLGDGSSLSLGANNEIVLAALSNQSVQARTVPESDKLAFFADLGIVSEMAGKYLVRTSWDAFGAKRTSEGGFGGGLQSWAEGPEAALALSEQTFRNAMKYHLQQARAAEKPAPTSAPAAKPAASQPVIQKKPSRELTAQEEAAVKTVVDAEIDALRGSGIAMDAAGEKRMREIFQGQLPSQVVDEAKDLAASSTPEDLVQKLQFAQSDMAARQGVIGSPAMMIKLAMRLQGMVPEGRTFRSQSGTVRVVLADRGDSVLMLRKTVDGSSWLELMPKVALERALKNGDASQTEADAPTAKQVNDLIGEMARNGIEVNLNPGQIAGLGIFLSQLFRVSPARVRLPKGMAVNFDLREGEAMTLGLANYAKGNINFGDLSSVEVRRDVRGVVLTYKTAEFVLRPGVPVVIGSNPSSTDPSASLLRTVEAEVFGGTISRNHMIISLNERGELTVQDLSTNGTTARRAGADGGVAPGHPSRAPPSALTLPAVYEALGVGTREARATRPGMARFAEVVLAPLLELPATLSFSILSFLGFSRMAGIRIGRFLARHEGGATAERAKGISWMVRGTGVGLFAGAALALLGAFFGLSPEFLGQAGSLAGFASAALAAVAGGVLGAALGNIGTHAFYNLTHGKSPLTIYRIRSELGRVQIDFNEAVREAGSEGRQSLVLELDGQFFEIYWTNGGFAYRQIGTSAAPRWLQDWAHAARLGIEVSGALLTFTDLGADMAKVYTPKTVPSAVAAQLTETAPQSQTSSGLMDAYNAVMDRVTVRDALGNRVIVENASSEDLLLARDIISSMIDEIQSGGAGTLDRFQRYLAMVEAALAERTTSRAGLRAATVGAAAWDPEAKGQSTRASEEHPDRNEDASFVKVLPNGVRIAGVFDGMGGHANGAAASRLAALVVAEALESLTGRETDEELADLLGAAMIEAAQAIKEKFPPRHSKDISGATAVVAVVIPQADGSGRVVIANSADTRAYVQEADGAFEALTVDNLNPGKDAARLILTREQARAHENREAQDIVSNIMRTEDLRDPEAQYRFNFRSFVDNPLNNVTDYKPVITTAVLPRGARLLLVSDGIHDFLADPEIAEEMSRGGTAQEVSDRLVARAHARTGEKGHVRISNKNADDMTAVVVDMGLPAAAAVQEEPASWTEEEMEAWNRGYDAVMRTVRKENSREFKGVDALNIGNFLAARNHLSLALEQQALTGDLFLKPMEDKVRGYLRQIDAAILAFNPAALAARAQARAMPAYKGVLGGVTNRVAGAIRAALARLGLRMGERTFENTVVPAVEEFFFTALPLLAFGPVGLFVSKALFVALHNKGRPLRDLTVPALISAASLAAMSTFLPGVDLIGSLLSPESLAAVVQTTAISIAGHSLLNATVDVFSAIGGPVLDKGIFGWGRDKKMSEADKEAMAGKILTELEAEGLASPLLVHQMLYTLRAERAIMRLSDLWTMLQAMNRAGFKGAKAKADSIDVVTRVLNKASAAEAATAMPVVEMLSGTKKSFPVTEAMSLRLTGVTLSVKRAGTGLVIEGPGGARLEVQASIAATSPGGAYRASSLRKKYSIGREPGNHLQVMSARVSRSHVEIEYLNGQLVVNDLNSSNGTIVTQGEETELYGRLGLLYADPSGGFSVITNWTPSMRVLEDERVPETFDQLSDARKAAREIYLRGTSSRPAAVPARAPEAAPQLAQVIPLFPGGAPQAAPAASGRSAPDLKRRYEATLDRTGTRGLNAPDFGEAMSRQSETELRELQNALHEIVMEVQSGSPAGAELTASLGRKADLIMRRRFVEEALFSRLGLIRTDGTRAYLNNNWRIGVDQWSEISFDLVHDLARGIYERRYPASAEGAEIVELAPRLREAVEPAVAETPVKRLTSDGVALGKGQTERQVAVSYTETGEIHLMLGSVPVKVKAIADAGNFWKPMFVIQGMFGAPIPFPDGQLIVLGRAGGAEVEVGGRKFTTAPMSLAADTVSRAHVMLLRHGDTVIVRDLNSRNGTHVYPERGAPVLTTASTERASRALFERLFGRAPPAWVTRVLFAPFFEFAQSLNAVRFLKSHYGGAPLVKGLPGLAPRVLGVVLMHAAMLGFLIASLATLDFNLMNVAFAVVGAALSNVVVHAAYNAVTPKAILAIEDKTAGTSEEKAGTATDRQRMEQALRELMPAFETLRVEMVDRFPNFAEDHDPADLGRRSALVEGAMNEGLQKLFGARKDAPSLDRNLQERLESLHRGAPQSLTERFAALLADIRAAHGDRAAAAVAGHLLDRFERSSRDTGAKFNDFFAGAVVQMKMLRTLASLSSEASRMEASVGADQNIAIDISELSGASPERIAGTLKNLQQALAARPAGSRGKIALMTKDGQTSASRLRTLVEKHAPGLLDQEGVRLVSADGKKDALVLTREGGATKIRMSEVMRTMGLNPADASVSVDVYTTSQKNLDMDGVKGVVKLLILLAGDLVHDATSKVGEEIEQILFVAIQA